MHSYDTKTATFHFDGAFADGDLIIHAKNKDGEYIGGEAIRIDANDILRLVAYNYVKDELISQIENMDWRELLSKGLSK